MKKLKALTAKIIGIKKTQINNQLSIDNESRWDSFNHLLLISEIEKQFKISFSIKEIESIKTYQDIVKLVKQKI